MCGLYVYLKNNTNTMASPAIQILKEMASSAPPNKLYLKAGENNRGLIIDFQRMVNLVGERTALLVYFLNRIDFFPLS
jgi:hypothetical protein